MKCDGVELPRGEIMKQVEEGYMHVLGNIVEFDKEKENEMKEKTFKVYKRRVRLILKGKSKITEINTWAVSTFRYGPGIISWKESELNV